ncbi:MAG: glycerophosphodiester phosphodiesterase family protein [Candidatus Aminicenantales bacterium]
MLSFLAMGRGKIGARTLIQPAQRKRKFLSSEIIGHRGASLLAPKNTVASAKLAWEKGADAVECDIWLSKDNKIICSHDANTKRTTGQDLKISETNSKILRKLDAGSFKEDKYKGEKLPFLNELIKTVPAGKELVIEIKCGSKVLPFLEKTIKKYERNRVFTFICFDFQTIAETKKIFPGNTCHCSNKDLLEANFSKVPEAGMEGISLHYSIISEDVMKRAAGLKLEVCSWTMDDPAEAKRLIALGVKGITTNRPGWLEEQINR